MIRLSDLCRLGFISQGLWTSGSFEESYLFGKRAGSQSVYLCFIFFWQSKFL